MSSNFNVDDTQREGGENNNACIRTDTSCLTIEQFLKSISNEYHDKFHSLLIENGITDLSYLTHAPKEMLDQLATDLLHMNFVEKLIFHSSISKLKLNSQPRNIITTTVKEGQIMSDIQKRIKNMTEVQTFVAKVIINSLENNMISQTKIIDDTFDKIIDELQLRRKELKRILNDEWKHPKLQEIKNEANVVSEYEQYLKQQFQECETLLINNKYSGKRRERKMMDIETKISEQKLFKNYETAKSIFSQLNKMAQLKQIEFNDTLDITNISKFGCFQTMESGINVELELHNIQTLIFNGKCTIESMEFAVKTNTAAVEFYSSINASIIEVRIKRFPKNKIKNNSRLDWKLLKILSVEPIENAIFLNENQGMDDDYKANDDFLVNKINCKPSKKCIVSSYKCILNNNGNKNVLSFKYNYQALVSIKIETPFCCEIFSNIKTIDFAPIVDRKKEIEIELKVHSYAGYSATNIPANMLDSDIKYYKSRNLKIADDWIVFQSKNKLFDQPCFYLTKVQVKECADNLSLKRFRILIGNAELNEWIICNNELFVARKIKNMQTFEIRLSDSKWNIIWKKEFYHFKIEILDNYGHQNNISVTEFKLFGVIYQRRSN